MVRPSSSQPCVILTYPGVPPILATVRLLPLLAGMVSLRVVLMLGTVLLAALKITGSAQLLSVFCQSS